MFQKKLQNRRKEDKKIDCRPILPIRPSTRSLQDTWKWVFRNGANRQTNMATLWLTRPRGPSQWKTFEEGHLYISVSKFTCLARNGPPVNKYNINITCAQPPAQGGHVSPGFNCVHCYLGSRCLNMLRNNWNFCVKFSFCLGRTHTLGNQGRIRAWFETPTKEGGGGGGEVWGGLIWLDFGVMISDLEIKRIVRQIVFKSPAYGRSLNPLKRADDKNKTKNIESVSMLIDPPPLTVQFLWYFSSALFMAYRGC